MMLVIFGIPLAFSLYLGFQGWSPDQALFAGSFAGTANYEDLLTDPQFLQKPVRHLHLHRDHRRVGTRLGLGIALLLNIDLPWIGLFRTALVVPMMITPIVARAVLEAAARSRTTASSTTGSDSHIVWLGRP